MEKLRTIAYYISWAGFIWILWREAREFPVSNNFALDIGIGFGKILILSVVVMALLFWLNNRLRLPSYIAWIIIVFVLLLFAAFEVFVLRS